MSGSSIKIKGNDGDFDAYLAKPASGTGPAIVIIQEIFGVNKWVRSVADHYASLGYVAVAPDLFWRFKPGIELDDRNPDDMQQAFKYFGEFDVAKGIADIQSSITAARGISSGKVGAVGYCLGGLLAYLTATRTDADASVAYYGVAMDNYLTEAAAISKPLLLHIASEDKFVSSEAQDKIKAGLEQYKTVQIAEYPGMEHAFARTNGEHYNADSANSANNRTEAFFKTNLA